MDDGMDEMFVRLDDDSGGLRGSFISSRRLLQYMICFRKSPMKEILQLIIIHYWLYPLMLNSTESKITLGRHLHWLVGTVSSNFD
jgi:hypothetical protein